MCTNTYWRLQQEIRYLATYWTVQCQMYSGGWGCSMDTIPASSLRFLFTVSYVVRRLIFFTAFLLRGEYTGHAGFPRSTMEFVVCVDAKLFGQNIAQTIELPVNWDTMSLSWHHCNALQSRSADFVKCQLAILIAMNNKLTFLQSDLSIDTLQVSAYHAALYKLFTTFRGTSVITAVAVCPIHKKERVHVEIKHAKRHYVRAD